MSRSGVRRFTFLAILALTSGATVGVDAQRAVFRTGIDMVPLTVTVTDSRGKYVNSLTDLDFTIFEDGVEQPVSFFASEQVSIDLALMIDVSASMQPNLPLVHRAARGLVRSLRPRDRATVVAVKNVVGVPQPLTADQEQVTAAIQRLTASGETALYDGLYVVLKELARTRASSAEIRKQALVVLSDGLDTASRLGFEDVKELARRSGVNIYVIGMPSSTVSLPRSERDGQILRAEYTMRSLAHDSGGWSFFPKSVHELPAIYSEIGAELAHQYEIGYQPSRPLGDRAFRRISVHVRNATARTRSGYYADARAVALRGAPAGAVPGPVELRQH